MRNKEGIASVYYEPCELRLTVAFGSGCTVVVYEVPPAVVDDLVHAEDRLGYFETWIRDLFPCANHAPPLRTPS
jgi:hypothetical protein